MEKKIHCTKCDSSQLVLQKAGFDGYKAIAGVVMMAIVLGVAWFVLIQYQEQQNSLQASVENIDHFHELTGSPLTILDYGSNKILLVASIFLLALSLLYGLNGANKNELVCLNCGNIQDLQKQNDPFSPENKIVSDQEI
jgi:hypothetical protein